MRVFTTLWGYIRLMIVVVHNFYHIPTYLLLNWVIFLPLRLLAPSLYDKIENKLYSWCLYTVSAWSWTAGIQVYAVGDELPQVTRPWTPQQSGNNNKKPVKILIVGNHQSTGDVPLLMYRLTGNPEYIVMWVMSAEFKYSNFGPVSLTHEDYFLNQRKFVKGDLVKHCLGVRDQQKNCYILFPEGGFRYKRLLKSNKFAAENNLPALNRVVWPRYGAFEELIDERIGVTHILDLTILYRDQEDPLSIFDIAKGIRPEPVHFLFRVYELTNDKADESASTSPMSTTTTTTNTCDTSETKDTISSQSQTYKLDRNKIDIDWLRNLWKEKEQIMDEFYLDREKFFQHFGHSRRVDLKWSKIICIHIFYLSTTVLIVYGSIVLYNLYVKGY